MYRLFLGFIYSIVIQILLASLDGTASSEVFDPFIDLSENSHDKRLSCHQNEQYEQKRYKYQYRCYLSYKRTQDLYKNTSKQSSICGKLSFIVKARICEIVK